MTDPQGTRRVALYLRVSRRNQRPDAKLERGTLAEQRELAERCLPRGCVLVEDERYVDVNVSGRKRAEDRPGLSAVFADIESGKIDDVVVGYLSRFGRSLQELHRNVERLGELGATLYVGKDSPHYTPGTRGTAKLLLSILGAVAEFQVDQLEDGLKHANQTALDDGTSIAIPYGYRRSNGPGSPLHPDVDDDHGPAPERVVRLIFRRRVDGVGTSEIAHELNAARIPTPTQLRHLRGERDEAGAQRWRPNTVQGIVETRTYKGVIPRAVAWEIGDDGKRGRPTAWEELPAQHPALVSDDDWKSAQITGRAIRNGATEGALLRGLVRCEHCSRTMRPSRSKQTLTYVCPNGDCPRRSRITRAGVDAYVVEQLLERHTQQREHVDVDRAERDRLVVELETLSDEYDTFLSRAGALPPDRFARANADYLHRLGEREGAIAELEARLTPDVVDKLRQFDELPLDAQRAVLDSLLDAVVIRPAPGRGQTGIVAERVVLIPTGTAPFDLSGSGRVVEPRVWPL